MAAWLKSKRTQIVLFFFLLILLAGLWLLRPLLATVLPYASSPTPNVFEYFDITPASTRDPNPPTRMPYVSPTPWIPFRMWVAASLNPYDPGAVIRYLPVRASPNLDSNWLGDLAEGQEVVIISLYDGGPGDLWCFVDKTKSIQGWEIAGWVHCNRLVASAPTPVPSSTYVATLQAAAP